MNAKEKIGLINGVVIILVIVAVIVFKCTGSKAEHSQTRSDTDYMWDCQQMIKRESRQNQIDFKTLTSDVQHAQNGNVVVMMPFKLMNSSEGVLEYQARCLFPHDGPEEIRIR